MMMTNQELRQAQNIMLIILKKFDSFCKQNDIKYFLYAGTLLGAVRHNGFIPWDDDIDVGMLRDDYEKFCRSFPAEQQDLILQNYNTDDGFGLQFSKIILKNTRWIESYAVQTKRKYDGLFLDVFCFDKIPSDLKKQKELYVKITFLNYLMLAKTNYKLFFKSKMKQFLYKILCLCSIFINKKTIQNQQLKICLKYRSLSGDCYVTNFGGDFYENIIPERYYKELIMHNFEDFMFPIPKEYDKILTVQYGDYMVPPEKVALKHEIVEFDYGPYKDCFL